MTRVKLAAVRLRYVWAPAIGDRLAEHLANNVLAAVDMGAPEDIATLSTQALEHERRHFGAPVDDRTIRFLAEQADRVWRASGEALS